MQGDRDRLPEIEGGNPWAQARNYLKRLAEFAGAIGAWLSKAADRPSHYRQDAADEGGLEEGSYTQVMTIEAGVGRLGFIQP